MAVWGIVYYLIQFYLFVVSGALAYLSLAAWINATIGARRGEDVGRAVRWSHLGRALGFLALAAAAFVGAVTEGDHGVRFDAVSCSRIAGYLVIFAFLPRAMRPQPKVWSAFGLAIVGEALLLWQSFAGTRVIPHHRADYHGTLLLYCGLLLIDIGISFVGARIQRALLRVRLIDRLVIAFTVFSLLLAQMVAAMVLGVVSLNLELSGDDFSRIMTSADRLLVLTLSAILLTSAVIGFYLARDLASPVDRLGKALRAIGHGDFDFRVQLRPNGEDEMHDLAREVNHMAARLKSAEALRNEFFSFVSHELRSPLTAIRGFVTTLESVSDFSETDRMEIYEIMHEESDRLLRMIGELLDLSRIQSGKPLSVQRERFDAVRHVKKVIGVLLPQSGKHEIKAHVPGNPVWLKADQDKFDQILINILANAIKYSPNGGEIDVSLEEDDACVSVTVADHGLGMSPEQSQKVFDKFYRVSEQDTPGSSLSRVEGSGLGLYLTRALVEAHGGRISVTSNSGEGSAFTVTLPKSTEGDEAVNRPEVPLFAD